MSKVKKKNVKGLLIKLLKHETDLNRPFPSSKKSPFQSDAKCEAIDMKMIFNYHANKTHFRTSPRFESEIFWNSEMASSMTLLSKLLVNYHWEDYGTIKETNLILIQLKHLKAREKGTSAALAN